MNNDDNDGTGIRCRTAMLELNLNYDGMADFLGVSRQAVISMCLDNAVLPLQHMRKVGPLLNIHRFYGTPVPVMELAVDFLSCIHDRGGRLKLADATHLSGLSASQLKNIENVEQWLVLVWEEERGTYGPHVFVYLTAAGYHQLGKPMAPTAPAPAPYSKGVRINGLDEAQQTVISALNKVVDAYLDAVDSIRAVQTMMVVGGMSPTDALGIYDATVRNLPHQSNHKLITQETNDHED